jgi:hypothetical protein
MAAIKLLIEVGVNRFWFIIGAFRV